MTRRKTSTRVGSDEQRPRTVRRLISERLENRILLTTVTNVDPPANSREALLTTEVSATFDQDINPATATAVTFAVHSSQRGRVTAATVSTAGATVTLDPTLDFFPGEVVEVTATAGIQSSSADPVVPRLWQFRVAPNTGSGLFVDSEQVLASPLRGQSVVFGDVDGDGDLDALHGGDLIQANDGSGVFTDTGQRLIAAGGGDISGYAEFADLDGDGDLDVVGTQRVQFNNGAGVFTDSGQNPFGGDTVEVGDLDGDGDMDVMTGMLYSGNRVWFNNGSGAFTDSGQQLGSSSTRSLEFGDFDGDGDLDAWVPNWAADNRVWMNDGSGVFTDSGQAFGGFRTSRDVDLGDVDGDGDIDAVVANTTAGNVPTTRVYLNDGNAVFSDSGQGMNAGGTWSVKLGDLDGDGDLDLFLPYFYSSSNTTVWFNDGAGTFSDSGQLMFPGERWGTSVDLADIDGDGDLDAWMTNRFPGGDRLWINQNLTPNVVLSIDNPSIAEAAGAATITATLSATHTAPVTIDLSTSGSATETDDYTVSATQIVIAAGDTTGSVTVTAVQDAFDEPDETVTVDIGEVTNGQEVGSQQVTTTIFDDDEPPVPNVILTVDNAEISEAGGVATFAVTLSELTTLPVTVDLALGGSASSSDYTASAIQVVVAAGETSGSVTVTAVDDGEDESDETVVADIVSVTNGNEDGEQQQLTTIVDDDAPPGLAVTALTPTASGMIVTFSTDLDASGLNLYDTPNLGLGAADLMLQGAASGPVAGSLFMDASLRQLTFIKTGEPLAEDTYTVTLRSAADGFVDLAGRLLDGNNDGTAGDDYSANFSVDELASDAITIGIPDFVRGPGQRVNLPASESTGIPITISEGTNVRAIDMRVRYDPALLSITGATVAAGVPAGATVIVNTITPGLAILVFFSSTALPAGANTFANLQASIPDSDPSGIYSSQQVLDVHGVTISDGNDNESPVVVDDAVHVTSYFADVSGNGRINASDAAQVARFAALIDRGFAGSVNADPLIVGDPSGNGRVNAADASLVAQFAALIEVPQIPPVPSGIRISGSRVDLDAGLLDAGLRKVPNSPTSVGIEPSQNQQAARHNTPGSGRTAEFRRAEVSEFHRAIDRLMTALGTLRGRAAHDHGSSLFEEASDELFSSLDDILFPSG